jgi:hypothetical protein
VLPGETIILGVMANHNWMALVAPASYNATFKLKVFAVAPGDADGDSTADIFDTCVSVANAEQNDTDGDGFGDACDRDFDQNGACNIEDFTIFREDFIATTDRGIGTDMDGSSAVSIADFSLFRARYVAGKPGPKGPVPLPN